MNWIDFGFEVEMPCWVLILCILVALAITILGFISAMKTRKVINKYINKKFGLDDDVLFKLNRKKGKPFEIDEFQDDEEGVEAVKETVNDMAKNIAEQGDAVRILKILKPRIKLKDSSLKNIYYNFDEQGNLITEQDLKETPVVFIQSSGFVLKNSVECEVLERWLNNGK